MKRILLRGRDALYPEDALARLGYLKPKDPKSRSTAVTARPTVVKAYNFSCWYSVYLCSKDKLSIELCSMQRLIQTAVVVGTPEEVDKILARRIARKGLIVEVNPGRPGKCLAKMPHVTALLVADELDKTLSFGSWQ